MIIKLYRVVINFLRNIKLCAVKRSISRNATLIGSSHGFCLESRVILFEGATKENVTFDDHVQMNGKIYASKNGVVNIGEFSQIGYGCVIEAVNRVEIGKNTAFAANVIVRDNNSHPISPAYRIKMQRTPHGSKERSSIRSISKPVIIGENVWIGEGTRICKGVTIGDNSIIGTGSVVTKDVPANAIAAGNPARIVKENIDQLPEPSLDD